MWYVWFWVVTTCSVVGGNNLQGRNPHFHRRRNLRSHDITSRHSLASTESNIWLARGMTSRQSCSSLNEWEQCSPLNWGWDRINREIGSIYILTDSETHDQEDYFLFGSSTFPNYSTHVCAIPLIAGLVWYHQLVNIVLWNTIWLSRPFNRVWWDPLPRDRQLFSLSMSSFTLYCGYSILAVASILSPSG